MERLPMEQGPNLEVFYKIEQETMDKFEGYKMTPHLVAEIEFFMNQRIKQEIDEGNFRNKFITPSNRIAVFLHIAVEQSIEDPMRIQCTPRWYYDDEEEENDTGITS